SSSSSPKRATSSRGCRAPTSPSGRSTTTSRCWWAPPSTPARIRARSSIFFPRSGRCSSSPCRGSGRRSKPAAKRAWRARRQMQAAIAAGLQRVRLLQAHLPVPPDLEKKVAEADAAYFGPIRQLLGLDRAVNVGVGAAPTPRDVLEFFHALGIRLAEGWG